MGDIIYSKGKLRMAATDLPTEGNCFGWFMRGSRFYIGITKKKDFEFILAVNGHLLRVWDEEWKREKKVDKKRIQLGL